MYRTRLRRIWRSAPAASRSAWRWDRRSSNHMVVSVDFERRIDFDRLRRYRLARARTALKNSPCGALLLFDVNNIRVSSTKIGEWGATSSGLRCWPATVDRSCGISARPRCITASTATGWCRTIAAPASQHARHRATAGGRAGEGAHRGSAQVCCYAAGVADITGRC